jgi:hypothetical protein
MNFQEVGMGMETAWRHRRGPNATAVEEKAQAQFGAGFFVDTFWQAGGYFVDNPQNNGRYIIFFRALSQIGWVGDFAGLEFKSRVVQKGQNIFSA